MADDLSKRSTDEVLDDHLQHRMQGDVESDIDRNYAPGVIVFTSKGAYKGSTPSAIRCAWVPR